MEKLPAQMTVIGISKPGGPEVLLPETRAVPAPGPGEILIKVAAAGVNRPDVAQRSGAYPPPPGASDLPGLEVAGTVVALGTGTTKHKLGDQVMSLGASTRLLMTADSPPRSQRIMICVRPSAPVDRYAIRDPSGDQRGDELKPGPLASGVCAPVAVSMSHSDWDCRSVMMSFAIRP